MKKLARFLPFVVLSIPAVAFGDYLGGTSGIIDAVKKLVNTMTIVVAGAALLVFIFGLVKFITKAGDPKSHEEGRSLMIWGTIALFVMVTIWGLVFFIQKELDIHSTSAPSIPTFSQ